MIGKGVGGNTTSDMLARLAADVYPWNPNSCLVLGMINDIIGGATAAAVETNLTSIYAGLVARQITPIPVTMYGWNGQASWTAGRETVRNAVNAWIKMQPYAYVDLEPVMNDGGSPPAIKAAYDSGDHLHPNSTGAQAMAQAVFTQAFAGTRVPIP